MTAPHSHQDAYNAMPATIERIEREKLADRVTVYRRGAEVVYANELRDGEWQKLRGAREAVEAERAWPLTLQERRATAADVIAVDEVRDQARRGLSAEVFRQVEPSAAV